MKHKIRYSYPIILKNERLKPLKISPEVYLRRLSKSERETFFGLKKVDFKFSAGVPNGFIGFSDFFPSKQRGRYPYSHLMSQGFINGSSDILASNYVVIIECRNSPGYLCVRLNLSFKLFKPTSTGVCLEFKENETDVGFGLDSPIGPFDYLHLKKKDLQRIKEIFLLVEKIEKDKKFKLCSELYSRALQGHKLDLDLRFLMLTTSLESLYLPKGDTELSFRLSLRVASLLSKYGYGKSEQIYENTRKIYGIRSDLIHSGKTDKLNAEVFRELTNIVRISLNLYLKDKKMFSEESLTHIIF